MVSELRLSIFDLRSEVQAQVGLGSALSDYVRAVSVGAGFSVHVILDEAPDRLPINVEAELLRIAQEAVTNALKHGAPKQVTISLAQGESEVILSVRDDGKGISTEALKAQGIDPFASAPPGKSWEPVLPQPAPEPIAPIRRAAKKVGRNDPCPCGSGKKFKKCCGRGG